MVQGMIPAGCGPLLLACAGVVVVDARGVEPGGLGRLLDLAGYLGQTTGLRQQHGAVALGAVGRFWAAQRTA